MPSVRRAGRRRRPRRRAPPHAASARPPSARLPLVNLSALVRVGRHSNVARSVAAPVSSVSFVAAVDALLVVVVANVFGLRSHSDVRFKEAALRASASVSALTTSGTSAVGTSFANRALRASYHDRFDGLVDRVVRKFLVSSPRASLPLPPVPNTQVVVVELKQRHANGNNCLYFLLSRKFILTRAASEREREQH